MSLTPVFANSCRSTGVLENISTPLSIETSRLSAFFMSRLQTEGLKCIRGISFKVRAFKL